MPEDAGASQIELKKLLASILSTEARRIVEGLLDGTIELTVPKAMEIVRAHIYSPTEREYMTRWTLKFDGNPTTFVMAPNAKTGEMVRVAVPVKISESKVYRHELIRLVSEQSIGVWVNEFRDSIALAAAGTVNRQPEGKSRKKSSLEDLL